MMIKIDCLGEICPVPIIRLQKHMKKKGINSNQDIMIITDHSCTLKSLKSYCSSSELEMSVDEVINGVWEIILQKKVIG